MHFEESAAATVKVLLAADGEKIPANSIYLHARERPDAGHCLRAFSGTIEFAGFDRNAVRFRVNVRQVWIPIAKLSVRMPSGFFQPDVLGFQAVNPTAKGNSGAHGSGRLFAQTGLSQNIEVKDLSRAHSTQQ
ncbi:MAG TPA: hypothetical protein VFV23_06605 [Verrucomicrobiae bacterium]|nr:hypothetical protein [Verrucomicrobiae bacterium]